MWKEKENHLQQALTLYRLSGCFYLHDLSGASTSNAFQTCQRIYNKIQRVVFGGGEPLRRERIKENVLPVVVLSSLVLAGIGLPLLPQIARAAIAQAKKPRPVEDETANAVSNTPKLGRSATMTGSTSNARRARQDMGDPKESQRRRPRRPVDIE